MHVYLHSSTSGAKFITHAERLHDFFLADCDLGKLRGAGVWAEYRPRRNLERCPGMEHLVWLMSLDANFTVALLN